MNFLSMDIGGSSIKFATVDEVGTIKERGKVASPDNLTHFLAVFDDIISTFIPTIEGVAISSPGNIDIVNGIIHQGGLLTFLDGFEVKKHVKEKFDLACSVTNDAKSALLAEVWLGNLRGIQNGAVIVLGSGVGGALLLNGQLLTGTNFQAGEISFMLRTTDSNMPKNLIGESLSATNFVKEASTILAGNEQLDGEIIFKEIETGANSELTNLFTQYTRKAAVLINNIQSLLDVEKILIGGGISSQNILITEISHQYHQLRAANPVIAANLPPLQIESCQYKNDSNLLGALYQLLQEYHGDIFSDN